MTRCVVCGESIDTEKDSTISIKCSATGTMVYWHADPSVKYCWPNNPVDARAHLRRFVMEAPS